SLPDGTIEKNNVASSTKTTLTLTSDWAVTPASGSAYTVVAPVVVYLACPASGSPRFGACANDSGGRTATGSGAGVTYANKGLTDSSKSWTTNEWVGAAVASGTSTGTVA